MSTEPTGAACHPGATFKLVTKHFASTPTWFLNFLQRLQIAQSCDEHAQ